MFESKTLLLALFLFSHILIGSNVWADDKPISLKIEATYIELHSGPGIGYPILNVIEKGESVEVLVKRTSWLKVKDQRNNIGWLNQEHLLSLSQQGEKLVQSTYTLTDFQNRDYEGGIMYGDFEGADFYNIYLGYTLSPVFSAEISAGKALGSISDSDLYEVMLISQPFPELTVIPYIGVGGGIINTKPHSVLADSENRQDTLMNAAIGLKYHLARNFLLRAEYKYSLVLTDRDDNEEVQTWKLGFSVFF
ncbi:MAG: outer membrane beta-barrel protein [Colwellia sp.]|nr:outer membrane beta-barrel protein [Colwellia sp.]MCW8865309.1 outer membrane beta-barrel protein [Colwellia sp.]MCW9082507.1 outer membrane beta-barrel protein [Colwellia sp.]